MKARIRDEQLPNTFIVSAKVSDLLSAERRSEGRKEDWIAAMSRLVNADLLELLAQAPAAVDSYLPGHWERMRDLEQRARRIIDDSDREAFGRFLCDVAFLKRP